MKSESGRSEIIPWYLLALTAILCGLVLIVLAILGPLMLGVIHYRTSQSGIWQTEGGDLANLLLVAPILLIGGILKLARKNVSRYLLILSPITLIYTGLTFGVGQEWSIPAYVGNVEDYFALYLTLIIGGLILLVGSIPLFSEDDAPSFKPKGLRIYVGLMSIFLLLFAGMWISQILQVVSTGNTADGYYQAAPNVFWFIRYFDLGVSIPLGFLALFLLLSKPKQAFPIILLFFGFFITMATTVNTIAIVEVVNHDPSVAGVAASGLVIFPVLGVLAYVGFFYLIKDKLPARHLLSRVDSLKPSRRR